VRILLDTHVFLWLNTEPERLGDHLALVENPRHDRLVSAASAWEIAIKASIGRLSLPEPAGRWMPARLASIGATPVPVEHAHALAVADLPLHHHDPFDRLLVAQAQVLGVAILTSDRQLARYDVDVLLIA
jgi:PIN domain nuclease of toxin-antitoxin system